MLGIIGAMEVEVKELREMMENPQAQTVAGMTFYQGTIRGKEVVVVRSGIGKVDPFRIQVSAGIACKVRREFHVSARGAFAA